MEPAIAQLSQSHLNDFATCPRKFQHRYLDHLSLPPLDEHHHAQQLGTQFHHLMQQQALGLDIHDLVTADPKLHQWFQAYEQAPPAMIPGQRLSEHQRLCWFQGFGLVVVYDLLILASEQAQILDWKTYQQPRRFQSLRQNWQTRLYLFVLAETSDYPPEHLSMTYWFAESGTSPTPSSATALTLTYNQSLHTQTHQELTTLLDQLHHGLTRRQAQGAPLPQVPVSAGHCWSTLHPCPFVLHCHRQPTDLATSLIPMADIHTIPEVPF